jgi:hypothetical protein
MNDISHPSAVALESFAAGDATEAVARHVDACADCKQYVAALEDEARRFGDAPAPAFLAELEVYQGARDEAKVSSLAIRRASRRLSPWVFAAVPLFAAAAAAVFVVRPDGAPLELPNEPTATGVRLKGPPAIAVVRERAGAQERFSGSVSVAPHDGLRLEVTVDREGTYEAGLLGEDGTWIVLLAPTVLSPGAHLSEKAARFDDRPGPGWLLAGSPSDVARARATRDFSGLAMVPVEVKRQ